MLKVISPLLGAMLAPSLLRFREEMRRPRLAQMKLLGELTGRLSQTEYGRALNIGADDDYGSFSKKVPMVGYDDILDWIERQKSEEGKILVADRVLFYEKTSGSSGAAKFIPYTAELKASFNRMFRLWLGDLLARGPRLKTGKTFISISPAFADGEKTTLGRKIGLEDDTEYLSGWAKRLLNTFLAVPTSIKNIRNADRFKLALATLLVAADDLEIISIWNPTFLEALLDVIEQNREAVIKHLERGQIEGFEFRRARDDRLRLLREEPVRWTALWPELKLISCWTSASAAQAARRIAERFPGVMIQGKGLLATEAPITFPVIEAGGFAPLPSEVFYEFEDEQGNISLLDEIEEGSSYNVIITQKGGLWRYRLGDSVRATHFFERAPCLEFEGRNDLVSDLVGEKLSEGFVQSSIMRLASGGGFQTLMPVLPESGPAHYVFVVDALSCSVERCEERLEELLSEGHQYRLARRLGQLGRARVRVVADAREIYYEYFLERGMKLGDIKHQSLIWKIEDARELLRRLL